MGVKTKPLTQDLKNHTKWKNRGVPNTHLRVLNHIRTTKMSNCTTDLNDHDWQPVAAEGDRLGKWCILEYCNRCSTYRERRINVESDGEDRIKENE